MLARKEEVNLQEIICKKGQEDRERRRPGKENNRDCDKQSLNFIRNGQRG